MDNCRSTGNLSALVEEHYALLYRYAYRLTGSAADAEDLTQQAFLTAQTKLHQLREQEHAKSWLCTIVRNTHLKNIRDNGRASVLALEHVTEPAEDSPIETTFDSELIQSVLDDMPEEFRSPLILFYFEEFSYKEIAEQMEVPIGTVMSRLARGKAYLRRRLAPREDAVASNDTEQASPVKS